MKTAAPITCLLAFVLVLPGCPSPVKREPLERDVSRGLSADEATIRIATFNIQVFGQSKAAKPEIMDRLGAIIRKYDVVAVQEIRDVEEVAPQLLLEEVNSAAGAAYDLVLGLRTGNQPDDMNNREQYAFYFRTATIDHVGPDQVFDDSAADLFQREPFMAAFKAKGGTFSFVLIAIHTDPDVAVAEIGALHDAVLAARGSYSAEDDFIVLGDFNAGCDFASPSELDGLAIRGIDYGWIIPDNADTNVSTSRSCAYDRIVVTANTDAEFTGAFGVDAAFTDSAVSDHWPVWAEFFVAEQ